ncbi:MAG: ABC transporter ATP-binding protein [Thioalkalivibrionaceae bacterium]
MTATEPQLALEQVDIAYGSQTVVFDANLTLPSAGTASFLGPSGCGKTTLLRAIAGFQPIARGTICIAGEIVATANMTQPPETRAVGMVFQDFALFPHLSVADNIAFGMRGASRAARRARVSELLRLVGLDGIERAYPHALSGGQQQRVALARALAPRPRLLLLDEPFSSLDVELRTQLAGEVRDILRREGIASILVTHDQHEAFAYADRIALLNAGHIAQWDAPYRLYHEPADRFVASFIGEGRFLPGEIQPDGTVATPLGRFPLTADHRAEGPNRGTSVDVLIRPDDLRIAGVQHRPGGTVAEVVDKIFRGSEFYYTLKLLDDGAIVHAAAPSHDHYVIGEQVCVELNLAHVVAFARQANS